MDARVSALFLNNNDQLLKSEHTPKLKPKRAYLNLLPPVDKRSGSSQLHFTSYKINH